MKQLTKKINSMIGMIILLFTFLLTGCDNKLPDDGEYEVRFAINAMSVEKPNDGLKSNNLFAGAFAIDPNEVTHVRIGIDGTHEVPLIDQTLPYNINTGITDPIRLSVGDHNVTSIYLLKEINTNEYEVLYSGVAANSTLSSFVTYTLPLTFHIPLLNEVPVNVDVVAIDDWTPEAFGWGKFNIGITTLHPLYFYGANNEGNPSEMSINVYDGNTLISTGTLEPEGWMKVLYPDKINVPNNIERYKFTLLKDGIEYERYWTVEEMLALPKDIILLNVYGSGMAGFSAWLSITFQLNADNGPDIVPTSYIVTNANNEVIFNSGDKQLTNVVKYLDTPINDVDEMYTITMSYYMYGSPMGWSGEATRTAVVSVATLKSSNVVYMNRYNNNFWFFN